MRQSPDAVYVIIPCMKNLGMSWNEIKTTPRHELTGLLIAYSNHELIHQFDGYSSEDINSMAKDRPELRGMYAQSMDLKNKMERRAGRQQKKKDFKDFKHLLG